MTVDDQGRPVPPPAGDELSTLTAFLDFQRRTLAWKTEGLSADGLNHRCPPTSMTLGGLLKHLAWVEDYWFCHRLAGLAPDPLWAEVDWRAEPDWEWTSAAQDSPETLHGLWATAVHRSQEVVDGLVAQHGSVALDQREQQEDEVSLRWILVHMIEEYARHNGHADLLREAVDGQTGE